MLLSILNLLCRKHYAEGCHCERLVRHPVLHSFSEGGSFGDPSSAAAAKPLPLRPSFARHSGPVLAIATTGGLREGGRVEVGSPAVRSEVGSRVEGAGIQMFY
jgi:hypothetical protein